MSIFVHALLVDPDWDPNVVIPIDAQSGVCLIKTPLDKNRNPQGPDYEYRLSVPQGVAVRLNRLRAVGENAIPLENRYNTIEVGGQVTVVILPKDSGLHDSIGDLRLLKYLALDKTKSRIRDICLAEKSTFYKASLKILNDFSETTITVEGMCCGPTGIQVVSQSSHTFETYKLNDERAANSSITVLYLVDCLVNPPLHANLTDFISETVEKTPHLKMDSGPLNNLQPDGPEPLKGGPKTTYDELLTNAEKTSWESNILRPGRPEKDLKEMCTDSTARKKFSAENAAKDPRSISSSSSSSSFSPPNGISMVVEQSQLLGNQSRELVAVAMEFPLGNGSGCRQTYVNYDSDGDVRMDEQSRSQIFESDENASLTSSLPSFSFSSSIGYEQKVYESDDNGSSNNGTSKVIEPQPLAESKPYISKGASQGEEEEEEKEKEKKEEYVSPPSTSSQANTSEIFEDKKSEMERSKGPICHIQKTTNNNNNNFMNSNNAGFSCATAPKPQAPYGGQQAAAGTNMNYPITGVPFANSQRSPQSFPNLGGVNCAPCTPLYYPQNWFYAATPNTQAPYGYQQVMYSPSTNHPTMLVVNVYGNPQFPAQQFPAQQQSFSIQSGFQSDADQQSVPLQPTPSASTQQLGFNSMGSNKPAAPGINPRNFRFR